MTWEEKFAALKGLSSEISLRMRSPGNWYVSQLGVEVKKGGILGSRCGNGSSPEKAVEDHWKNFTELSPGEYLVIDAYKSTRRAVEWNGFMWEGIIEGKIENIAEEI